ncbi:ATP phosphoribosyltransferase regulatory subunit [Bartonella sp. LJL80]
MTQRELTATAIESLFAQKGLMPVSIPILQPADPFLDMAGEDLRRRIFMTENENGDSLCLRPEFTIPVCIQHIATGAATPRQYAYIGEVFRQNRQGDSGFHQAGIEDLGDGHEAQADARSLRDALDILALNPPLQDQHIILGDQSVFAAMLDALGLAAGWQKKLLRAFGNHKQLRSVMEDIACEKGAQPLPDALAAYVNAQDETALVAHLEEEMFAAGISPSAGRNPMEIAKRLLEKQQLSFARLAPAALKALEEFLTIRVPLGRAEQALTDFGKKNGLEIEPLLSAFQARNHAFAQAGIDLQTIEYDAAFGRPLDYYTGLVYEIRRGDQVVVGGGRYDRLMTMLGAKGPIPAVGFSIWLDRLNHSIWLDGKGDVR